jgi:hypothetical protein
MLRNSERRVSSALHLDTIESLTIDQLDMQEELPRERMPADVRRCRRGDLKLRASTYDDR